MVNRRTADIVPGILLIDDDEKDRMLLRAVFLLYAPDARITDIRSSIEFVDAITDHPPDIVVVERHLSWADGLEVVAATRRIHPRTCAFVFSRDLIDLGQNPAAAALINGQVEKDRQGPIELVKSALAASTGEAFVGLVEEPGRALLDTLPAGALSFDETGDIVSSNQAARCMLGHPGPESDFHYRLDDVLLPPEGGQSWRGFLTTVHAGTPRRVEASPRLIDAPGVELELEIWPVRPTTGQSLYFGATLRQCSPGEPTVPGQAATGEMEQPLSELVYAVTHDLRDPVRVIDYYAGTLQERLEDAGNEGTRRSVERLVMAADQMKAMLDGLQAYAKAGDSSVQFVDLPFDEALDDALESLSAGIEESGAVIQRCPLPILPADRQQITHLFRNLVGNAIKFRSGRPLHIDIGATEKHNCWVFGIKDNGIGIEPSQQEKIFGLFHRLHTSDEYPGTGIGLALCKRIVQRHGGRIWVRSVPEKKTAFFFTIPKNNGQL